MNIPYRHRRVLNRVAVAGLVLLTLFLIIWLCWVVWLQRYVVYTGDGARLDFDYSSYEVSGMTADSPKELMEVSIFYNEGADAIDTTKEMTQINGYYITSDMFQQDMDNVMLQIERLKAGTAIMIDMKGPYGSFFYASKLAGAVQSASTDIQAVAKLVDRLESKGFYTIAKISAFRDREFGLNNVPAGLYMLSRKGLWMDTGGMYWLDPTNATTTNWISSVVLELRDLGFDEVLLDNFRFPTSDGYIFNGDKAAALEQAAATLVTACESQNFVLSFCVEDPTFPLPEGRTRMYLTDVSAQNISRQASMVTFEDPEIRLVFLCENGDTRYDDYSVLRTLNIAEEVEARNAG